MDYQFTMWGDDIVWYTFLFVLALSLYMYWISKKWTASEKEDKDVGVDKQTTVNSHDEDKPEFPYFFPNEVWEKVLKFITTKEDIESCYNSCRYLQQFLYRRRKNEVLLPEVFQILLTKHYDMEWQETLDEILNFRLICKSINSVIEKFFEGDVFEVWERDHFVMFRPQRFLDHFEATHYDSVMGKPKKNPFLGGTIQIYERLRRGQISDIQVFRNTIMEVFRKYGQGIGRLHICLYEYNDVPQLVRLYRQLQDMMTFLPNLKNLNISFSNNGNISEHTLQQLQRIEGLDQEMAVNPIPTLVHLKLVSVKGHLPDVIFRQLILQNQHITELEVCSCLFQEVAGSLPCLKDLKLRICTMEAWIKFETSSELCLEKLNLDISKVDEETLAWSRVLRAVETKMDKETYTELYISMPEPIDEEEKRSILEDSHVCRLEMPKLQVFTIETRYTKFCLDFLLPCRNSLKKITVVDKTPDSWEDIFWDNSPYVSVDENEGTRYGGYEERQIIKFLGYEDILQNSNISMELSTLKALIIRRTAEGEVISYEFKNGGITRTLL